MQVVSNTSPLSALAIILLRAKHEGGILSMRVEMERLVLEAGFFVSERIRKQFLAEAGETDDE